MSGSTLPLNFALRSCWNAQHPVSSYQNLTGPSAEAGVQPLVVKKTILPVVQPKRRCLRGFSIIDVTVTMAIITVLVSLLTPALSTVRETAHQVVCRSNVRQMGLGIGMFAEDHKDIIPNSLNVTMPENLPWETNTLRYGTDAGSRRSGHWDGLGHLYRDDYLPAPKLFYCPSHHGNNPYAAFAESWSDEKGLILANYQYRGAGPAIGGQGFTTLLSGIDPGAALISDCLRSESEYNHEIGANLFRANFAVTWFSDRDRLVADLLPKDGEDPLVATFLQVWQRLDQP